MRSTYGWQIYSGAGAGPPLETEPRNHPTKLGTSPKGHHPLYSTRRHLCNFGKVRYRCMERTAQISICLLLKTTTIKVRVLTNSGNHTCATQGSGMRNNTSRSFREAGHRIVAQSPA